jgi:TPR repeat protein
LAGLGDRGPRHYFIERGVAKSTREAARWWTKAAALGHPSAAKNFSTARQYNEYIGGIHATPPSFGMATEGKRVQIKGLVSKSELSGLNAAIVRTIDGADGKCGAS